MANLKPEIMERFISILESTRPRVATILSENGWGESSIEVNKHAELYVYPAVSSPAFKVISRLFVTPRISSILRIRIAVQQDVFFVDIGNSIATVKPRPVSKGRGFDELGKPYVEYEITLPASIMTSSQAEDDVEVVISSVVKAFSVIWG